MNVFHQIWEVFSHYIFKYPFPRFLLLLCLHYASVGTFGIAAQTFDDRSLYLLTRLRRVVVASRRLSPCGAQPPSCIAQTPGCMGLVASQRVGSRFP